MLFELDATQQLGNGPLDALVRPRAPVSGRQCFASGGSCDFRGMVRGPKGAVTADDSRRDRSVLRGSAGGTAACGRAVTARVRADEGNRASVRPARASHASRRRRRGRCLFAVVGRGGYTVHLVDPVRRLVEEAQRGSAASPNPIATYRVGDARKLAFGDGIADGVLLLGPLYHLTEAAERLRALREAHRSG
nr:MAG: hypothetical protein DIU78_13675 [Pseudomonadota bacterium]